jgi:hypothetical protein
MKCEKKMDIQIALDSPKASTRTCAYRAGGRVPRSPTRIEYDRINEDVSRTLGSQLIKSVRKNEKCPRLFFNGVLQAAFCSVVVGVGLSIIETDRSFGPCSAGRHRVLVVVCE